MSTAHAGLELLEILNRSAPLEFKAAPHTGSSDRAPFVVWRFMHEDSSAAQKLVAAIHDILESKYSTWELRQGRTWLLAPRAFLRMEDAASFGSYAEILNHLQETDPELGRRSNMELQNLVEALREFVNEHGN